MTPIVDPNIFYWISMFESARTMSIVMFVISVLALIALCLIRVCL